MNVRKVEPQSAARRKMHVWVDHYGLTRDEFIEFMQYLLRRDYTSSKQMDEAEVERMLDAFQGHHLLSELAAQRVHAP